MKRLAALALLCAALSGLAQEDPEDAASEADEEVSVATPQTPEPRLLAVDEWELYCAAQDVGVARCREIVHHPPTGRRAGDHFELLAVADQELLQSRSGILFDPELNTLMSSLEKDSTRQTVVWLEGDVRCRSYAAPPYAFGMVRRADEGLPLIHSWLRESFGPGYSVDFLRTGQYRAHRALRFAAHLADRRLAQGLYLYDAGANAAIFATCDHPDHSDSALISAELFFHTLIGSARRYG